MNQELLRRFLIRDRKLTGSTPTKTIRNIAYLERHNALAPESFADFTFHLLEENKVAWYNKLIQAITHYWAFMGIDAIPPLQHTPTEKIKEVYSNDEIVRLLRVLKPSYRECLLISAYTGCRIGEARHLTAPQINLVTNCVTLFATKTKNQRIVPLADGIQTEIKNFVKGKEGSLFNFSDTALDNELKRCCIQLKIRYRPPRCFRNSFATRQAGKDLFATMNILGHKNPKTTLGYWVSNLDALKKTIDSDSLGYATMPTAKKLALLRKHLQELRETLQLDHLFEVHLDDTTNQISFTVKVKPAKK